MLLCWVGHKPWTVATVPRQTQGWSGTPGTAGSEMPVCVHLTSFNSANPFLFHPIPVTRGHSVCIHSTRPVLSVQVASPSPLQRTTGLGSVCLHAPSSGGCSSQTDGQVVFQSPSKAFKDYFLLFVFFPAINDA